MAAGILPHCDEIMTILLENLSNQDVHRQVKPQILSVFGDVALAIGADFKKYLEIVLQTLMQASQAQVDRVSERTGIRVSKASHVLPGLFSDLGDSEELARGMSGKISRISLHL